MASGQLTTPLHNDDGKPIVSTDRDGLNEQAVARGPSLWFRFKYEWKWENLWFDGDYPNTYGKLHWTRAFGNSGSGCWCCSRARGGERDADFKLMPPIRWLLWRGLVCAYLSAIFIYSISTNFSDGAWFEYLTNWQSTIFMIYGWLSLISSVFIYSKYRDTLTGDFAESARKIGALPGSDVTYKVPYLIRFTWVTQGCAMSLGIWVTVLFWINVAIFGYYDPARLPYNLLDHFSTMFIVLLDFSFAAFPWLLFQFVWSAFIAIAFTIWSVIFYVTGLTNKIDGGRYIYKGLEWQYPVPVFFAVFFLIVIGIPLCSIVVWALSSEMMGRCAPKRLIPWVDQDGTGGHRFKSWKKPGAPIVADLAV